MPRVVIVSSRTQAAGNRITADRYVTIATSCGFEATAISLEEAEEADLSGACVVAIHAYRAGRICHRKPGKHSMIVVLSGEDCGKLWVWITAPMDSIARNAVERMWASLRGVYAAQAQI